MEKALAPSQELQRLQNLYVQDTPAENKAITRTEEFRKKLAALMTKDIKDSFASIGTYLQWMSQLGKKSKEPLQFSEVAVLEFNRKYNLYCLFTEWCAVNDPDYASRNFSELSPAFFSALTEEIAQKLPSRKHNLTINGIPGPYRDAGSLHFIVKAIAGVLANSASESKVSLQFRVFVNRRTRIEVMMESDKPISKIGDLLKHFNGETRWFENTNALLPFPEIAMVKDILEDLNGELTAQAVEKNIIHVSITL
jgi:hypothetical protein